jgi:hypothetical protein
MGILERRPIAKIYPQYSERRNFVVVDSVMEVASDRDR